MKYLLAGIFVFINTIISCAHGIDRTSTRVDNNIDKLGVGEDISIQSYSASFAKRLGLSKSIYGEPQDPIKAYEYRITRAPDRKYTCYLNVYFDHSMDFKYPEGDIGASQLIYHKLLVFKEMNLADRRFWGKKGTLYNQKIFLASNDYVYRKKGFKKSLPLSYYRKNLLEDVGFMSIFIPNCSFKNPEASNDIALWFEKSEGKDYTKKRITTGHDDFNKYPIPREFSEKINTYTEKAILNNRKIRKMIKGK